MEGEIEVLGAPDLSDFSKVGGVRLVLPGWPAVDLSPERAAKLAEAIIGMLYQTGRLRRTI